MFFLTYQLARRLFHDETAARLTVLLLTIYPNQIAYTGVLFSETLATFLLLLGFNIFMTRPTFGRTLASSLVLGFGALVKAQYLLSPGILLVIYGWGCWRTPHGVRRVASLALIFVLGVTAVVLPVTIRNYVVLHHFVLISTNGGIAFRVANNPEARGDDTRDNSLIDGVRFSVEDQVAAEKRAYAIGIDWIRNNPGHFAILVPMKIWRLWAPDGEGEWWFQRGYAGYDDHAVAFRMVRIFNQLYYTALLVGTAAAILLLLRRGCGLDRWVLIGPGPVCLPHLGRCGVFRTVALPYPGDAVRGGLRRLVGVAPVELRYSVRFGPGAGAHRLKLKFKAGAWYSRIIVTSAGGAANTAMRPSKSRFEHINAEVMAMEPAISVSRHKKKELVGTSRSAAVTCAPKVVTRMWCSRQPPRAVDQLGIAITGRAGPPDVAKARTEWRENQPELNAGKLVFIDEAWTKT